jgi:hypothetical protein
MLICGANAHSLRCDGVLSSAMRLCTLFCDFPKFRRCVLLVCDCAASIAIRSVASIRVRSGASTKMRRSEEMRSGASLKMR